MGAIECQSQKQNLMEQVLIVQQQKSINNNIENISQLNQSSQIFTQVGFHKDNHFINQSVNQNHQNINNITFRNHLQRSNSQSPQFKNTNNKNHKRFNTQLQYINGLLNKSRERDMRLELKRHLIKIQQLQQYPFHPKTNRKTDNQTTMDLQKFLKGQQEFIDKKIRQIQKSRQSLIQKQKKQNTYQPLINQKSIELVRNRKFKNPNLSAQIFNDPEESIKTQSKKNIVRGISTFQNVSIELKQDKQKCLSILMTPKTPNKNQKKQQGIHDDIVKSNDESFKSKKKNNHYLALKLQKQFWALLLKYGYLNIDNHMNYLKFTQIMKDMNFVIQSQVLGKNSISERKLLNQAWKIISKQEQASIHSILGFIMAVCGLKYNYIDTLKRYYEPIQSKNQFNIQKNLKYEIQMNQKNEQNYLFNDIQIKYICQYFKQFYITKVTKSRGYSQILKQMRQSKQKIQINNRKQKILQQKYKKQKKSQQYQKKRKIRVLEEANKLGLINSKKLKINSHFTVDQKQEFTENQKQLTKSNLVQQQFTNYQINLLQKKMCQIRNQQQKIKYEIKLLNQCSFKPSLNNKISKPSRYMRCITQTQKSEISLYNSIKKNQKINLLQSGFSYQSNSKNKKNQCNNDKQEITPRNLNKKIKLDQQKTKKKKQINILPLAMIEIQINLDSNKVQKINIQSKQKSRKTIQNFIKKHNLSNQMEIQLIQLAQEAFDKHDMLKYKENDE